MVNQDRDKNKPVLLKPLLLQRQQGLSLIYVQGTVQLGNKASLSGGDGFYELIIC